jgi:hypothetical protein
MAVAADHFKTQDASNILTMQIGLPSDLPIAEIVQRNLVSLLKQEVELRHGQLCSIILQCYSSVKLVDVAHIKKAATAQGQGPNTRANGKIAVLEEQQDFAMAEYNCVRAKLLKLGKEYVGGFPVMARADLYCKSTVNGRNVGTPRGQMASFGVIIEQDQCSSQSPGRRLLMI